MRFQRFRNARLRPRFVTAVRPLPTMVTLGNLLCGFGSVCLAMLSSKPPSDLNPAAALNANACLYWSGLLIFIAMLFDVMDGRVARWTRMSSRFGMEMDSLADMISFGLAPAVLVKAALDNYRPGLAVSLHAAVGNAVAQTPASLAAHVPERYVWLMLATYIACTALRLARYNVEAESGHRNFFFGLPSPGAAGCVAGLIILTTPTRPKPDLGILQPLQEQIAPLTVLRSPESAKLVLVCLPFLMMCLGILMVSRVHYLHVGDKLFGGRRSLMHLLLIGLGLVLIIMQHEIVLATTFVGYMLLGLVNEVRFQLFSSQRPAGWVVSADDLALKRADRGAAPPAAPAAPGGAAPGSAPPPAPGAVR